jgi:Mg-chelatase subunit ChlD
VLLPALAASLLLAALPARGQEQSPPGSCLRRTVLANVIDRQGFPVDGFGRDHFRASFRGEPVQIVSAEMDARPRRIVVVLDASGSMIASPTKWDVARRAAGDLVALVPAENATALITFGDRVYDRVELTRNPLEALTRIEGISDNQPKKGKVGGRTALFDALLEALSALSPPAPGDVIYLITDGGANAGKSNRKQAEGALLASGTRVFVFALLNRWTRGAPEEQTGPSLLNDLTRNTGGGLLVVQSERAWPSSFSSTRPPAYPTNEKDQATLAALTQQLYRQMTTFYRLEIELLREVDKPREWKLQLVPSEGVNAKDFRLHYHRKLLPCGKP